MFKQFEILLEGFNPEADGPMTADELSRLRRALPAGEALQAYVRGRVVGSGEALWALTDRQLVVLRSGRRGQATTLPLNALQLLEAQAGRYGTTLALSTADQRLAIYAADPALAQVFSQAATGLMPTLRVAALTRTASPEALAEAGSWTDWSRRRLQDNDAATAQGAERPAANETTGQSTGWPRAA